MEKFDFFEEIRIIVNDNILLRFEEIRIIVNDNILLRFE